MNELMWFGLRAGCQLDFIGGWMNKLGLDE